MTDVQPPQPGQPYVAPPVSTPGAAGAPYAPPSAPAPYIPQAQADRPRRGWIWAIVVLVLGLGVLGSCAWSVSLLGSGTKGSPVTSGDAIAVIPIDGVIAGTGSAGVITPEDFLRTFEQAEKDDNVKAIVLRIDSPGGTVAASEEIASYVRDSDKPVVVTVGDVCASGAYMVASQATKVFALPGSAVGSIGVITDIPNVSGLLDKVGVKFTVVKAGKYKDAGSPYRALTKEEQALIQGSVDQVYDQFIELVADGRGLPRSDVESMATGWAWNGEDARDMGLIDATGTYRDAMAEAAKLGKIRGDYETVDYRKQDFEDVLDSLLGLSERLSPLGAMGARDITGSPALAR